LALSLAVGAGFVDVEDVVADDDDDDDDFDEDLLLTNVCAHDDEQNACLVSVSRLNKRF
jgi:hypothetical protein